VLGCGVAQGVLEAPLVDVGILVARIYPHGKLPFAERALKVNPQSSPIAGLVNFSRACG
jgi:hypothetical protein